MKTIEKIKNNIDGVSFKPYSIQKTSVGYLVSFDKEIFHILDKSADEDIKRLKDLLELRKIIKITTLLCR